ncbi:hypothetical protein ACTJI8_12960 [Microbacterium sp. 22303]|uniref:hypothetical protein n=1 Tax=Microbacterium sp. 22303 TaxID=3453905 RepID=UPI003F835B3A
MTNIDDVAQTLAEYERLAITSGATVRIDPPEFSDGSPYNAATMTGAAFQPFWLDKENPPKVARVTVWRDGTPTTVYASWDESLPSPDGQPRETDGRLWHDVWLDNPMERFGSFITRAALRRAFREVIGDRTEPDEDAPKSASSVASARDWESEIAAAPTSDAVHALHAEMKRARAVTPQLEAQLRNRLTAAAWAPAEDPAAEVRTASGALRPTEAKPGMPQDFLAPTNRAARRAKSKGRRK